MYRASGIWLGRIETHLVDYQGANRRPELGKESPDLLFDLTVAVRSQV